MTVIDLTEQEEPITLRGLLRSARAYHQEHAKMPEAFLMNEEQTEQFYDALQALVARGAIDRPGSEQRPWQGIEIRTKRG